MVEKNNNDDGQGKTRQHASASFRDNRTLFADSVRL